MDMFSDSGEKKKHITIDGPDGKHLTVEVTEGENYHKIPEGEFGKEDKNAEKIRRFEEHERNAWVENRTGGAGRVPMSEGVQIHPKPTSGGSPAKKRR